MRKSCEKCGADWWKKAKKKDICRRCGAARASRKDQVAMPKSSTASGVGIVWNGEKNERL